MHNSVIHIHKTEHLSKVVSLGCSFKFSSQVFNNTQRILMQYLKFEMRSCSINHRNKENGN